MTGELAQLFVRAMNPTEEDHYKRCMQLPFWTMDDFAALANGLLPENYRNGSKGNAKMTDASFRRRSLGAVNMKLKFLDYLEQYSTQPRHCIFVDQTFGMSSWRYIKWLAEGQLAVHQRFLDKLPLQLMELFREFLPINAALRIANRHSSAYHKAHYLTRAGELLQSQPYLIPSQLYAHPQMQGVQRYIRELGGTWEKRTYLGWLKELIELPRGRPRKQTS